MNQRQAYYVYVLWSSRGRKFYIGVSEDIEKRLAQHNQGVSLWTRRFAGSWRLVWQCELASLSEARKLESQLKRQKGGNGFWMLTATPRALTEKEKEDFPF